MWWREESVASYAREWIDQVQLLMTSLEGYESPQHESFTLLRRVFWEKWSEEGKNENFLVVYLRYGQ